MGPTLYFNIILMKITLFLLVTIISSILIGGPLQAQNETVTLDEWKALCFQLTKSAALKACDEAIKLAPQEEKLWLAKGDAFFGLEKYSQAEQAYTQALEINKMSALTWQKKGQSQAAQSKYTDAIISFEQALLLDNNNTSIWFDKGLAFFLQDKNTEADQAYSKFLNGKVLNLVLLSKVAQNTLKKFQAEESYRSNTEFFILDNLSTDKKFILKCNNNINSSKIFLSEIEVLDEKKVVSQLQIIGDGEKVWAYRPDLKQYTSFTYEEFVSGDKLIFTGLYNFFFLLTPDIKPSKFITLKTLLEITNTPGFKQKLDIISGQQYLVYEYQNKANEPSFRIWVNQDKATIAQVQFGLQSPEIQAKITEKIYEPIKQDKTFQFIPPKNAKLVKELPNLYPSNLNIFR